jgi:hypothetical protein
MPNKSYKISKDKPIAAEESAIAYQTKTSGAPFFNTWNSNTPFHGTEAEWWEHFHRIEEGKFMTIEEADKEFEIWRKNFLANRM